LLLPLAPVKGAVTESNYHLSPISFISFIFINARQPKAWLCVEGITGSKKEDGDILI